MGLGLSVRRGSQITNCSFTPYRKIRKGLSLLMKVPMRDQHSLAGLANHGCPGLNSLRRANEMVLTSPFRAIGSVFQNCETFLIPLAMRRRYSPRVRGARRSNNRSEERRVG